MIGAAPGIMKRRPAIPDPTNRITLSIPKLRPNINPKPRCMPNAAPTAARLSVFGPGLPARARAAATKLRYVSN